MGCVPRMLSLFGSVFCAVLLQATAAGANVDDPGRLRLELVPPSAGAWLSIHAVPVSEGPKDSLYTLERSADLVHWLEIATLMEAPFTYQDPGWNLSSPTYYRAWSGLRTPTNDWANQVQFPSDPFWVRSGCDSHDTIQWAKFLILMDEPDRVYFQDCSRYPLHYNFATVRLPAFQNLDPPAFDAIALHRNGQRVVLGSVLAPLDGTEYGIQFAGQDPYPPAQVAAWFRLVKSCLVADPAAQGFYLPSYEQSASVTAQQEEYRQLGIPVISAARWLAGQDVCYSPGWAIGRLVYLAPDQIQEAYDSGALLPTDILVTDAVAAELPYVSGIISLSPATPNSHVAILADSYGVPFAYIAASSEQARVRALHHQEVAFRTGSPLGTCLLQIWPLTDPITPAFRESIQQARNPRSLNFAPKEAATNVVTSTEGLTPDDIRYVGGKAANFGLLRRVVPDHSPNAIAFSFVLWDAFLDQTLPTGGTLRAAIKSRLEPYSYPPNVRALRADLAALRDLIINTARFTPEQERVILTAVEPFGTERKIRFRSSTNVEDAEYFTGAGLYDSYSGCLGDDVDLDTLGPSHCDQTDLKERGVLLAMRRVYASFYNDNAFLERLRLKVSEDQAGMALLVHYSTPDEIEMANGVATVRALRSGTNWLFLAEFVSQKGAVSVANPDPGILSEEVSYSPGLFETNLVHRSSSSLVQLGSTVLEWPKDYQSLGGLVVDVSRAFTQALTNRSEVRLDLEYKKVHPGWLEIKQVREIPFDDSAQSRVPALLASAPFDLVPYGPILSMHRLKSRWRLGSANLGLASPPPPDGLFNLSEVEVREGDTIAFRTNLLVHWPKSQFSYTAPAGSAYGWATNTWTSDANDPNHLWSLITRVDRSVDVHDSPVRWLSDCLIQLSLKHSSEVPLLTFAGESGFTNVLEDQVTLYPLPRDASLTTTQHVVLTTNGLTWSVEAPLFRVIGTAPMVPKRPDCFPFPSKSPYAFVGGPGVTFLAGLTPTPLELHNPYAQTLVLQGREGHETVYEAVADPWMEPTLGAHQKAALTSANIRLAVYHSYDFGGFQESVWIVGLDGSVRRWR